MDRARRRTRAAFRNLLGFVMAARTNESNAAPDLLRAVALLADIPSQGLVRGQVGTIVETLDEATALVEFSDDEGRAYAIAPRLRNAPLSRRTAPWTA